jgi:hypothetical protein
VRGVLVFLGALVILWGPTLLFLTLLVPTGGGLPAMHLAVASALTLILVRILYALFRIRIASAAPGRFRIIPRYPSGPVLLSALAIATALAGLWEASTEGSALAAVLSVPGCALLLLSAAHVRRRPLWEGFVTIDDGLLRVETPAGGYTVPLGQIRRIYRRTRDHSFFIETPWAERNTLILTRAARGMYWVDGADALLEAVESFAPVVEVETLLRATRSA